jgi:polyisoprenoid-binding protein YceI
MTTSTATAVPAGTYSIDPVHSRVGFAVRHLGIATVRGHFGSFEGSFEIGDELDSAKVYGSVEAASVDTQEQQRDDHLRSADFFDVERFPRIEFESKEIRPLGEDSFEIVGDLTMHGVTREISLSAEILGTESDPWGNERVGVEARGELNRKDYGMTFNQVLGSGNVLVSDKVKLVLEASVVKQA